MKYKARKTPKSVLKAKDRLLGMVKIDADKTKATNYRPSGAALTVAAMEAKIASHTAALDAFNTKKLSLERELVDLLRMEKEISGMATDVLTGARVIFGQDSVEVELVGGIRQSERKAPRRKAVPLAGTPIELTKTA